MRIKRLHRQMIQEAIWAAIGIGFSCGFVVAVFFELSK